MHRYATAPRPTFEQLFAQAHVGPVVLAGAAYPPVCGERSGEVRLSLGPTGAMIVRVEAGPCHGDDFRLRVLFETGTCVFPTPDDLCRFWTGPLAAAFGLVPAEHGRQHAPPGPQDEVPSDRPAAAPADTIPLRAKRAHAAPDQPHLDPTAVPERRPTTAALADELGRVVRGQDAALERVASVTVAQLTKRHPARPGSVFLLGPTAAGKTSTVEALPGALEALGIAGTTLFRLDCGELTDSIQATRLLGAPPGYSGHTETTSLLTALGKKPCILLVDELDKAHPEVRDLLLGLLDAGRLTSPSGNVIDARHVVIALTTSAGSDDLMRSIGRMPLHDRWAVQRLCAEHLLEHGIPAELVGRIDAFAVYAELEGPAALCGIAQAAVTSLGREYGLVVARIDPVVLDVVGDIAAQSNAAAGARGLHHAARELLAEQFATLARDGPSRPVTIDAGPPLAVRTAGAGSGSTGPRHETSERG